MKRLGRSVGDKMSPPLKELEVRNWNTGTYLGSSILLRKSQLKTRSLAIYVAP